MASTFVCQMPEGRHIAHVAAVQLLHSCQMCSEVRSQLHKYVGTSLLRCSACQASGPASDHMPEPHADADLRWEVDMLGNQRGSQRFRWLMYLQTQQHSAVCLPASAKLLKH